MKLRLSTAALLCFGLVAACETRATSTFPPTMDRSLASALFQSEADFIDRAAAKDAYGMARAARARLDLIELLDAAASLDSEHGDKPDQHRRRESLLASVRDMVASAKLIAQDEPGRLARIERLFPASQTAQSDGFGELNGLIGARREVKVTIGLELDLSLEALEEERIQLPVDASAGTTIYVQPAGHRYLETRADMSLSVSRRSLGKEGWDKVDCPQTSAARLPCYVPAGDHTEIEIRIKNRGEAKIQALLFVSGNAESVQASMVSK